LLWRVSLNNLAGLYKDQGRYGEAEPLYKRSLAIDEKALAPDHPKVATALGNLASLYDDQGRYADAEHRTPALTTTGRTAPRRKATTGK